MERQACFNKRPLSSDKHSYVNDRSGGLYTSPKRIACIMQLTTSELGSVCDEVAICRNKNISRSAKYIQLSQTYARFIEEFSHKGITGSSRWGQSDKTRNFFHPSTASKTSRTYYVYFVPPFNLNPADVRVIFSQIITRASERGRVWWSGLQNTSGRRTRREQLQSKKLWINPKDVKRGTMVECGENQ